MHDHSCGKITFLSSPVFLQWQDLESSVERIVSYQVSGQTRQQSGLHSHISRPPFANDAHCELLMKQITQARPNP
jgi:hypothetical protein